MKPNIVFLLTDQWRLQAFGYTGNTQVKTPNIDKLAEESTNFTHATAGWSVCCPWRASMLTGQYPLTHGVFVNDVGIGSNPVGMGTAFKQAGYDTAFIGKWHVDGQGRSNYIPSERRLGFDYFKALECTHDYNNSAYYDNNDTTKRLWEGYDVFAQADDAMNYIENHNNDKPFMLLLSWGPPHNPYDNAPQQYRDMYQAENIKLRPNIPPEEQANARKWLAGYYAHCTAIDKSVGDILKAIANAGLGEDTIVVFASDHGDMLGSQGQERKQRPWDESIRVPFIVRVPHIDGSETNAMINAHDILPTLLGLCDADIPDTVEGRDFSPVFRGEPDPANGAALLACFHPFGEYSVEGGGREYRGIRTHRYTYTKTLEGAWQLYDNETDPYQLSNLVNKPEFASIQDELEARLQQLLDELDDKFEDGMVYIEKWGYPLDETGTVPYTW